MINTVPAGCRSVETGRPARRDCVWSAEAQAQGTWSDQQPGPISLAPSGWTQYLEYMFEPNVLMLHMAWVPYSWEAYMLEV